MWCRQVRSQLSAYADGELGPAEARPVENHLRCCEECSRELRSLQQLVSITASIPAEEVPSHLHTAILSRLAYAEAPAFPARRRPSVGLFSFNPWVWTAVSGALAALVMGLVQKPQQDAEPPAPREVRKVRTAPRPARPEVKPRTDRTAPRQRVLSVRKAEPAELQPAVPARTLQTAPEPARMAAATPAAPARRAESSEMPPSGVPVRTPCELEKSVGLSPAPVVTPGMLATMPGSPVVNSVNANPPAEALAGMEKDGMTRMAGSPAEPERPTPEEGLRMFLEERGRPLPQPGLPGSLGTRPMRKL